MRTARMEGFTSVMNWDTLKIGPQSAISPTEMKQIQKSLKTGEDIHETF